MTNLNQDKKIFDEKYVQLTNKILNDRFTGINQFGQKSNLNLIQNNYALKTGTSREYHDSWTIGYTPDFLIGVWVGNADDTAMKNISGSAGAGKIWQESMNLLINSKYNKKTKFNFLQIKEFTKNNNIEYGLNNDNYDFNLNLLNENKLILNPHNEDVFLLEPNMEIIFRASEIVDWFIDDKFSETNKKIIFKPGNIGKYNIRVIFQNKKESLNITILPE